MSLLLFGVMISLIAAVPIELQQYQQLPDSVVVPFNGNRIGSGVVDDGGIRVLDIGYGHPANGSKNSVNVDDEAIVTILPLVADGEQPILITDDVQMSRDAINIRQPANIETGTMFMVLGVPLPVAGTGIPSADTTGTTEMARSATIQASEDSNRQTEAATGTATESTPAFAIGSTSVTINSLEKDAEPSTVSPITSAPNKCTAPYAINSATSSTNTASGVAAEINPLKIVIPIISKRIFSENPQIPPIQLGNPTILLTVDVITPIPTATTFIRAASSNPSPSAALIPANTLLGTTNLPHEAIVIPESSSETIPTNAVPSRIGKSSRGNVRFILKDAAYIFRI